MKWIAALTTASAGRLIAIDGKTKRLFCGWDHDYLLKVLTGGI